MTNEKILTQKELFEIKQVIRKKALEDFGYEISKQNNFAAQKGCVIITAPTLTQIYNDVFKQDEWNEEILPKHYFI